MVKYKGMIGKIVYKKMEKNMKKILITGASGYIASLILPEFRKKYDLNLIDNMITNKDDIKIKDVNPCNLISTNNKEYKKYFKNVDAVIHLAYKGSNKGGIWDTTTPYIDRFSIEHENVLMANNVYRTAYDTGVKRVIVASSNHATDWYEHKLIHKGKKDMITEKDYPVSDNFYGWAKATYELLSWPYASGKFGRKLEFIHVRIGAPRNVNIKKNLKEPPGSEPAGGGLANFKRDLGAYISQRDLTQLFKKSIETENINNKYSIPYLIVYGCSDNTRRFWSLESAKNILKYEPKDDSEIIYSDEIRKYLTQSKDKTKPGKVGI